MAYLREYLPPPGLTFAVKRFMQELIQDRPLLFSQKLQ